ncbi:pyridoxamine 5'-phosphate oxidase family protein [Candidatus Microgenomates bacterium]|nr:pyridoxamine 5'-phosphate oxidase family protein [Candidatus Microgenomates bacterium]
MHQKENTTEALFAFIKEHPAAHLATVTHDGKPFASTVYVYANTSAEIYIATLEETEKFKNIQANRYVALVITDEVNQRTVQIQGTAAEETDPEVRMAMIQQLAQVQARNKSGWPPPIIKLDKGRVRLVKVVPTWIRFSDFGDSDTVVQFEVAERNTKR